MEGDFQCVTNCIMLLRNVLVCWRISLSNYSNTDANRGFTAHPTACVSLTGDYPAHQVLSQSVNC